MSPFEVVILWCVIASLVVSVWSLFKSRSADEFGQQAHKRVNKFVTEWWEVREKKIVGELIPIRARLVDLRHSIDSLKSSHEADVADLGQARDEIGDLLASIINCQAAVAAHLGLDVNIINGDINNIEVKPQAPTLTEAEKKALRADVPNAVAMAVKGLRARYGGRVPGLALTPQEANDVVADFLLSIV